MNLLKTITLTILLVINTHCWASNTPPNTVTDLFDLLTQKAEKLYHNSAVTKAVSASTKLNDPFTTLEQKAEKLYHNSAVTKTAPTIAKTKTKTVTKPIVPKHKQFSDKWWENLFGSCKGCSKTDTKINCAEMLKQNPQWQQVASMRTTGKRIVTKRTLSRLDEELDFCNFACALCAGGNPNERLDGPSPHTALHLVAEKEHDGLFDLLLKKGVDTNLTCIGAKPIQLVPKRWIPRLKTHGAID